MNIKPAFFAFALLLLTCCMNRGAYYQVASSAEDDHGNLIIFADWNDANGKKTHFEKTFSVKGYTKAQKDALTKRIFDSLHVFRTQ